MYGMKYKTRARSVRKDGSFNGHREGGTLLLE